MALPFSSMVIKLGLNGSLAPAARTSLGGPFPSAKEWKELIFFLNRVEMRFRWRCFSARERPQGAAGNAKPCWWRWLILALRGCPGPGMTLSFRDCEINLERRELWHAKRAVNVEP